jgi:PAS domain S-box-containing protein
MSVSISKEKFDLKSSNNAFKIRNIYIISIFTVIAVLASSIVYYYYQSIVLTATVILTCIAICTTILNRNSYLYIKLLKGLVNRNKELINASENVIYTLDAENYKPTYISKNVTDLTGYSPDEIINDDKFWLDHVHPEDLEKAKAGSAALYKQAEALIEYRVRKKDDDYIWVQDRASVLKNDLGESKEIVGSWVDVSNIKKTELKIKENTDSIEEQKEYFKNLLQNLSTATFIISPQHKVLFWNKACEELTGFPAEKVVGTDQHWRGFYRLKRPCLADVYIEKLNENELYVQSNRTDENHGRLHAENWCTVYGGRRLYLAIDVGPIFDKKGNLVAVVENLRDLTTHRNMEIGLIDARDKALEAAKIKSEFLANMSHEIRTPMNGVLGMMELLKQTHLSDEQKTLANTAFESAQSLLSIINEVLDFSKIDAGHLQMEHITFNLHKLISELQSLFSFKARDKNIGFHISLHELVPEYVAGDPTRVRQVLINLLGNAVKFTDKGSVNLVVNLNKETDDSVNIKFEIKDTGIGIPFEKQDTLFDEFSQVDASTTRTYGGTGLGLAITKKILDLMSARITLQSENGEGTCFNVYIPFEKVEAPEGIQLSENVVALPTTEINNLKNLSSLKILLVEDNKVNQKVALGLLKHLSLKADIAENGEQAVEKYKNGKFDLVLMDCQMPVMSGYEATEKIREYEVSMNLKSITIIAMTANAMEGDREKCIAAGMDDYISKPINKHLFKEKIIELCSEKDKQNNEVSPMSESKTTGLIDISVLEELRSIMEDEFVEVLQVYLEESLSLMSEIYTAFEEESDNLTRAVHTLKSSSNNVGAIQLGSLSALMEEHLVNKDAETAKALLDELQDVFSKSHAEIKDYAKESRNEVA